MGSFFDDPFQVNSEILQDWHNEFIDVSLFSCWVRPGESLYPGDGTTKNKSVDTSRSLISVDCLKINEMTNNVIFSRNAISAKHVTRLSGNIQGFEAGIALNQRSHFNGVVSLKFSTIER